MLLGDKEKTIKLYAENFLQGNLTFDYGEIEDERQALQTSSAQLSTLFKKWLDEDEKNDKSEEHKSTTDQLYKNILGWRIRGRVKGKIENIDLEARIEELVKEKARLEDVIKEHKEDNLKAVKIVKEQDRQIALLESQIFYLKQGMSSGH